MSKKSTISDPSLPKSNLKLSFEFYDDRSDEFCVSNWNREQIRKSLLCLREINRKSFNEILYQSRQYHFNEVIWNQTIKKSGFEIPQISRLPAFHFSLVGVNNQLARIFGAYSQDTFYIVWFDLRHEIWPSRLKHT